MDSTCSFLGCSPMPPVERFLDFANLTNAMYSRNTATPIMMVFLFLVNSDESVSISPALFSPPIMTFSEAEAAAEAAAAMGAGGDVSDIVLDTVYKISAS